MTTNPTIGVARILKFKYPYKKFELTVIVNGVEKKEKFKHKKDRFIVINYDKSKNNISIIYPDDKYIYD